MLARAESRAAWLVNPKPENVPSKERPWFGPWELCDVIANDFPLVHFPSVPHISLSSFLIPIAVHFPPFPYPSPQQLPYFSCPELSRMSKPAVLASLLTRISKSVLLQRIRA